MRKININIKFLYVYEEGLIIKRDGNPIDQHHVPQVYLRNFCKENGDLAVLNKNSRKIFSTGTAGVGFEKNFYTLDKLEDPYYWERTYAKGIEPLMGKLFPKILSRINIMIRNGQCIIDEEEKKQLALIMVMQLLRGKQSRKYEEKLFTEKLPFLFSKAKEKYEPLNLHQQRLMDIFKSDPYYFKQIAMEVTLEVERIIQYTNILVWHKFIFFHLSSDKEFVTSDNPVMFINSDTADARPFHNGLLQKTTIVYYPISSKVLLCVVHPEAYLQVFSETDGYLLHLNKKENNKFVDFINQKQCTQCYNQVYASQQMVLEKLQ